jgi:hypothetical protein
MSDLSAYAIQAPGRPPGGGPRRALRWIGWSAFACLWALFVLVVGSGSAHHRALDKTVVIERLGARLAHAEKIEDGTAREISQLLQRPDYDCRQTACDAGIAQRNAAARARVETILARQPTPPAIAASR